MLTRRRFLEQVPWVVGAAQVSSWMRPAATAEPLGDVTVVSGSPRERGRKYGRLFVDEIREFLDREVYAALVSNPALKEDAVRYAGACGKVIRSECPIIADELEGMAEGTGLRLEEHILLASHEELYHRGILPSVPHCTAVAVGKPRTKDGGTYVGQTWDWMPSVAGKSRILEWKRLEGPSLLAYGFPGLWVGAGLNSSGLALCWTSAALGQQGQSPRIGLPAYVLLTHLMYQESLEAVRNAAERNRHAGWFTFVMADAAGRLMNIEGSPQGVEVVQTEGRLVRVGFGTHKMSNTVAGETIPLHPRCAKMEKWLDKAGEEIGLRTLQDAFADASDGVCERTTIDMMVFDTTNRIAHVSRGPKYPGVVWKEYKFS